jgi:hypothetical protein
MAKKLPHSRHQTQWAAQFAVASESCKRGYKVALTLGNHPVSDIMAISPSGVHFHVDLKGLHRKHFWQLRAREKKTDSTLFYVFALVPSDTNKGNRFFIISQAQVNEGIQRGWKHARTTRRAGGLAGGCQMELCRAAQRRLESVAPLRA